MKTVTCSVCVVVELLPASVPACSAATLSEHCATVLVRFFFFSWWSDTCTRMHKFQEDCEGEKPIKSDKLVSPCGCWRRNTQREQLLFFLRLPTRTSRFLLAALQPPPAELRALEVAPFQRLSTSFLAISSVSIFPGRSRFLSPSFTILPSV